uniref:Uncharacterized protein n=1 Tax=candidate division CPR3 bacterium TaxID=2268181 RepID=A0A7V3J926_UNCC3
MLSKSKSFGLIETLIACGILMMAAGATTALGIISVHGTVLAKHKTEAYMIAQDAMERIKGARDQVWEKWNEADGITWQKFWDNATGDFEITRGVPDEFPEIQSALASQCVFINHDTGALTEAACTTNPPPGLKFQRFITKDAVDSSGIPSGNIYKVTVRVEWSDYGQTQSVSLVSYLTNWKPRY